jgi:asparagine synthase (glutamine-hydrolysing)
MKNSSEQDPLSRILENDIDNYLVDDIMTKADISSMQNSLELRVPFLDHCFAEQMAKIPSRLKIKDGQTKYILRQACKGMIPEQNVKLPKRGFELPLKHWFKEDLKTLAHDNLLATDSPLKNYLEMKELKRLLQQNNSKKDLSNKIWNLVFLNSWLKKNVSETTKEYTVFS